MQKPNFDYHFKFYETAYNGYFKVLYEEEIPCKIAEELQKKMPHGSGINYDWYFTVNYDTGNLEAYNRFDAMTEHGYYCHVWDFCVIVPLLWEIEEESGDNTIVGIDYKSSQLADVVFLQDFDDCKECFSDYYDEDEEQVGYSCGEGLDDYLEDTFYYALTHNE